MKSIPINSFPGSPPRARGAGSLGEGHREEGRITPARAGSRQQRGSGFGLDSDHPRARGEQVYVVNRENVVWGSPPRARGAGDCSLIRSNMIGITPARAGSSVNIASSYRVSRDHPRARGEQKKSNLSNVSDRGSPPRARGAAEPDIPFADPPGITPARAGSSLVYFLTHLCYKDHPRARGEQSKIFFVASNGLGSPPRARGAVSYHRCALLTGGITPARAGSSGQKRHV